MNVKELIIVLATGGTLFATGATVLQGSSAWKNQTCASNLKSLYQSIVLYSGKYQGELPPSINETTRPWTFWYETIRPEVKDNKAFYCPGNPKGEKMFGDPDELLGVVFDRNAVCYGMNYSVSATVKRNKKITREYKLDMIQNPAHLVFLGDSKGAELRGTKWCWKADYAPVHDGKTQIIFADGHVDMMDQSNLGMMDVFDGWKKDTTRWVNWKKAEVK